MKSILSAAVALAAGVITRPEVEFRLAAPRFRFDVVCVGPDGVEKWRECFSNLVTDEGANSLLSVYFDAATQITAWYCGLKATGSANAADTLASHGGWAEVTDYSGNRKALTFGTASARALAASSAASFAINATVSVYGALIASVASGTSGVLYSAGNFTTPRSVANGDTINVTPTLSFT